jgi:hypothetical protein
MTDPKEMHQPFSFKQVDFICSSIIAMTAFSNSATAFA